MAAEQTQTQVLHVFSLHAQCLSVAPACQFQYAANQLGPSEFAEHRYCQLAQGLRVLCEGSNFDQNVQDHTQRQRAHKAEDEIAVSVDAL
jgi:hypothetical protein